MKLFPVFKNLLNPLRRGFGLVPLLLLGSLCASAQFVQSQKLTPQAAQRQGFSAFGAAVALEGTVMVVGASAESGGGAVYVFEKSGGTWAQTQRLVASDRSSDDDFGRSVGLSGNTLVVAARLNETDASGMNSLDRAGAVYVFERSGGTWSQTQKLVASDRAQDDFFGEDMALSGSTLVVGAQWEDEDANGNNTALFAGSAYVFEKAEGTWAQTQKLVATDRAQGDLFGHQVGVSGSTIVVGAYFEDEDASGANTLENAGSVYVFEKSGGAWSQTQKLVASDRAATDYFGYRLDLEGNTLAVAAFGQDTDANGMNPLQNAGAVYVFEKAGTTWAQTQKLVTNDRAPSDQLAYSVAVSGNTLVAGTFRDDKDANGMNPLEDAGSAYVFKKSGGTWSQTQKLAASDRAATDYFGNSIAFSGNTLVVGAYFEDEDANGMNPVENAGSAYVFESDASCEFAFSGPPLLTGVPLCAGSALSLSFSADCAEGLTFTAQLSDAGGSFASPTDLGSVSPGDNSLTVPTGTPAGTGYQIRVVSTNPAATSAPSAAFVVNSPAVSMPSVSGAPVCAGQSVTLAFTATCVGTLTAQLSDAGGSFASPTDLGSVSPGDNSLTVPTGTPAGTGYQIRVVSTNPAATSAPSAAFVVNGPAVSMPSVSGAPVCAGQSVTLAFTATCVGTLLAELSDANGGFASPVSLGSVSPGSTSLLIPLGTAAGSGYKIRVVSSNPALNSESGPFQVKPVVFNSTPTVSLTPACAGGSVRVSFTLGATCPFPAGNAFTVELSDKNGSFAAPVTLTGTVAPGINTVSIPQTTPTGTGYRVRVVATAEGSPAFSALSAPFTVNQPAFAGTPTVSGDNKCAGQTVRLSFAVSNCPFFSGNDFTLELSDATGSNFASIPGAVTPGALNNVTIPAGTPAGTGYKLRVKSSNPMGTSAASANFKVKACGGNSREVAPAAVGLQVRVSPNPSPEGRLRIAVTGAEGQALRVDLFNGVGQTVRNLAVEKAGEAEVLDWDVSRQPAGLYLLRVSDGRESKTVKVLH